MDKIRNKDKADLCAHIMCQRREFIINNDSIFSNCFFKEHFILLLNHLWLVSYQASRKITFDVATHPHGTLLKGPYDMSVDHMTLNTLKQIYSS